MFERDKIIKLLITVSGVLLLTLNLKLSYDN